MPRKYMIWRDQYSDWEVVNLIKEVEAKDGSKIYLIRELTGKLSWTDKIEYEDV